MEWDVIVVGGGPSGLTIAAELAGMGVRTLVLERRSGGVQSRAGTILPRVLELFDARGIADRFVERTRTIVDFPFRHAHIWAGFPGIQWQHLDSRFGFTLGLPQNLTEEILWSWALENGAEIRKGEAVRELRQHDEGVDVETVGESGATATFRARYLIGADGGRSVVRTQSGIPFEGHSGTFRGIAVDTVLDAPWHGKRTDVNNEMGWARGYAFGAGITRFNIVHRDRRRAPKDEPVTVDEIRQCLRDIHGTDYGIEELRWASRFDDTMRSVPTFRSGRVMLVGESARIHYPASGVGMNFCLQDAFNLGWKLANVINGTADESILDSYDAERLPVMRALLESVKAQCALQFNFEPDAVALKRRMAEHIIPLPDVQRKLVLELSGLEKPYPREAGSHPLTGQRVPDFDVVTLDGQSVRVAELLRNRRFLLLDLEGESHQFAAIATQGLPIDVVPARLACVPASMNGVTGMLVRPDAYVAWASSEVGRVDDLRVQMCKWMHGPATRAAFQATCTASRDDRSGIE
ncbi:monooxygenase [Burkholderia ubonensis]|uniref:FAD-dependent monooxygenase n=1 Tax=Burkholderia ubonensis TaxID=101571 RepID=UPI000BA64678|nr:FAD-dependent monooxygenase [Burkholderia ubonensis]PAK14467.1 monooxygenase [Burkholderia ubonensis]RQP91775.1 FAD-dependent oxidoreductase [Burkholderia ubonensis]